MPFHHHSEHNSTNDDLFLQHKPLWPLDASDYVGLGLAALALMAAACGGVGGGGLILPIFIVVLDFHMKQAVALSNATILGGAIANVMFAIKRRHPFADRPLINWDLILVMEPIVILGSVLGSFANKLLPDVVLQLILVLMYGSLSYQTMRKSLCLVKEEGGWKYLFSKDLPLGQEQQHHQQQQPQSLSPLSPCTSSAKSERKRNNDNNHILATPNETTPLVFMPSPPVNEEAHLRRDESFFSMGSETGNYIATLVDDNKNNMSSSEHHSKRKEIVRTLRARERGVQWWKPALMTLCFMGMATLRIGQKLVPCGSIWYWVLTVGLLPWVLPFFIVARRHVILDFKAKTRLRFPLAPGDVHWTRRNTIRWPLVCSLAGIMSGMLGSSGGTIKAPLLLELGTPPTVTSATVAQMILFTSASSCLALAFFGQMPKDYAPVLFLFGILITFATDWATSRLLARRRKQSLAMLSIALVITLSTITMGAQSAVRIVEDPRRAKAFGKLCG